MVLQKMEFRSNVCQASVNYFITAELHECLYGGGEGRDILRPQWWAATEDGSTCCIQCEKLLIASLENFSLGFQAWQTFFNDRHWSRSNGTKSSARCTTVGFKARWIWLPMKAPPWYTWRWILCACSTGFSEYSHGPFMSLPFAAAWTSSLSAFTSCLALSTAIPWVAHWRCRSSARATITLSNSPVCSWRWRSSYCNQCCKNWCCCSMQFSQFSLLVSKRSMLRG